MSPALSGAVARGLAPHSSFAQRTMKTYRNKSQTPRIKPEPNRTGTSTVKMENPSRSAGSSSTAHIKREQPPSSSRHHDTLHTTTPQIGSRGELHQMSRSATSSNQHLRGSFQGSQEQRNLFKPRSLKEYTGAREDLDLEANECLQCGEIVKNKQENCLHHPGRKKIIKRDGVVTVIYSCCEDLVGEPGCHLGSHITKSQHSMGPLEMPYSLKKPRIE